MLSFKSSAFRALEEQNRQYIKEIEDLRRNLNKLLRQYEEITHKDINESSFSFDFDNTEIKVFSIERVLVTDSWSKNVPKTVIGFIHKSEPSKVHQWNMRCSSEQHEKFVKQFEESIKRDKLSLEN